MGVCCIVFDIDEMLEFFMNFLNIEKNKIYLLFFFKISCFLRVSCHFQYLSKIRGGGGGNNSFSFHVFFMFFYAGNIEKFPFTYWLNGRWLLQIIDIHVGNFNMKLTGRWFPQIVDRDSGNLYPIYMKQKLWC